MILHKNKTVTYLILVLLITSTWLVALELDHPKFFTEYDNITAHLTFFVNNWNTVVKQQTIPLISFHQRLGHAYLTEGVTAVLSPIPYIAVGLSKLFSNDVFYTIEIIVFFYRLLGAAFMFLLLRQLKMSPTISTLGTIIWSSYPYFITTGTFWLYENYALAYLPLNFLLLEKLIAKPRIKTALLLAIIKTWFMLEGYPEYTFMILVFEIPYILLVLAKQIDQGKIKLAAKLLVPYVVCLAVFALSASPLILPTLNDQAMSANRSGPVSFSEFMGHYITLSTFTKAQLFSFFPKTLWWASSYIYYIGFLNLSFLALLLIRKVRVQAKTQRVVIYAIMALIAFMMSTSLHKYLYNIPPFYYFRRAEKYYPLFILFLTIANTGILASITKRTTPLGKQAVHAVLILSILLNVLVVWTNKETAWLIKNIESPIPVTKEYTPAEQGRIITFTNYLPNNDYSFTAFNFATLYGVNDIGGYDALRNDINFNLSLKLWYKNVYTSLPDKKTLDHLSFWSVRYLITRNNTETQNYLNQNSQLKLLYKDDKILLYENTEALPYVYNPTAPTQTVPHEFGINEVNIYPTDKNTHQLVVNIAPLPRYVVYFDGKKYGRVVPAYGPIMIDVPAYTEHVLIRYEDPLFQLGITLFISTWLSLLLIYLIHKLTLTRKPKYREYSS